MIYNHLHQQNIIQYSIFLEIQQKQKSPPSILFVIHIQFSKTQRLNKTQLLLSNNNQYKFKQVSQLSFIGAYYPLNSKHCYPYNIQFYLQETMSIDKGSKNKIHESQPQKYSIHLSSSQLKYLSNLLPKNFSFQQQTKLTIKTNKTKVLNQLSKTQGQSHSRVRKVTSIYNQQSQPLVIPKSISSKKTSVSQYINQQLKHCSKILNSLKNSKYSWPFRQPVDPVEMGVPQYYQIVTEPMDLQTVQKNLQQNLYTTATQFHADINKIIRNSYTFNKHNQQFTKITAQFEKYYIKVISAPVKNMPTLSETNREGQSRIHSQTNKKKKKSVTLESKDLGELLAPTLTEKKQLSQQIRRLNKDDLRGVVQIVYGGNSEIQQTFDIQDLPTNKVRQLQKYVKEKISLQDQLGKLNKKSENVQANLLPKDQQSSFMVDSDS